MEDLMIRRRHHTFKELLIKRLNKLERINRDEEQAVSAEIAKIKRSHIQKFGHPKPLTDLPLNGIVSEKDDTR